MKYLIIGADSYSGWNLSRYLHASGHEVMNLGRDYDLTTRTEDILSAIAFWRPKIVVNFAAKGLVEESWNAPDEWINVNVRASIALIEKMRHLPIEKYIHASTPEVYGSGEHDESSPYNPSTPYAASKAAMDMLLMAYHRTYGFPCILTRAANVYGPGQTRRLIPIAIDCAMRGGIFRLHGDGTNLRHFINIADLCSAYRLLAQQGAPGEIYNIAPDEIYSIKDILEKVGCRYEMVQDRKAKDAVYRLSCEKMKKLGWKNEVCLDEGLKEIWAEKLIFYASRA